MNVEIRSVTSDDWQFILDIRNEKEVRDASLNDEIISKETHQKYMKKLEERTTNVYQRIILYNKQTVGYVKVVDEEISYMIMKEFRGKGIGSQFFVIVFKELKELGITKIRASIRIDNVSSLNLGQKMGYKYTGIISKNNKPFAYKVEKKL
ncbi:MAG: GNAT family N-acetyltransferase [Nitrosopumilus sp.]|nr:GNAT family N-acetyltransferase [Nitrosopumilus sp.]